jgi:hypothetical protein
MTTIVGIKAGKKGQEGIVLASDTSSTFEQYQEQGDVIFRQKYRGEAQKIIKNNAGDLAFGMSGRFDEQYGRFMFDLEDGEIDFKKALEENYFVELQHLNLWRMEGRFWDGSKTNSLLVATRFDKKPILYTCWPLGRIEEKDYTAIGSGSNHALNYLNEKQIFKPERLSLKDAVSLANEALEKASTDLYTSGTDIVVITPEQILEFGPKIKKDIDKAKKNSIENILKEL